MPANTPSLKTARLNSHNIAYFPVPKVASSSIKMMLVAIETGKPFQRVRPDGTKGLIHKDYVSTRFFVNLNKEDYKDDQRIAVIRDPVERIISAFIHRVKMLNCLSEDVINMSLAKALNIPANPPLHIFVKNLEKYRILSDEVRHHTDRFTDFLGPDLKYFTHVFMLNELPKMVDFLTEATGVEAVLPKSPHSTKKDKINFLTLGFQGKAALLKYCAGDYALLKDYYSMDGYLADAHAAKK